MPVRQTARCRGTSCGLISTPIPANDVARERHDERGGGPDGRPEHHSDDRRDGGRQVEKITWTHDLVAAIRLRRYCPSALTSAAAQMKGQSSVSTSAARPRGGC